MNSLSNLDADQSNHSRHSNHLRETSLDYTREDIDNTLIFNISRDIIY